MTPRGHRQVLLVLLAILSGTACTEAPAPAQGPDVAGLLGGDAGSGFARSRAGTPLSFPRDHGPHPDYRSEWWYITGNLEDDHGRHFGFQLTFFRFALTPPGEERASSWGSRQVWMAHLAVSDPAGDRFVFRERLSRGALALAGARGDPLTVWLDDWRLQSTGDELLPLELAAADDGLSLDLILEPGKRRILQGQDGYSAKGPESGNASWYYSYTRLPVAGRLAIGDDRFDVTGEAWLDREWSTSALGLGVEGWDWFALQLDDGWELMYYRLRRSDGGADGHSAGVLVNPSGQVTHLAAAAVEPVATRHWTSSVSGVAYPVAWTLRVPSVDLELDIEPWQQDQEMNVSVRYWEGAVKASGRRDGRPLSGNGYLELAGYRAPGQGSPSSALPPR